MAYDYKSAIAEAAEEWATLNREAMDRAGEAFRQCFVSQFTKAKLYFLITGFPASLPLALVDLALCWIDTLTGLVSDITAAPFLGVAKTIIKSADLAGNTQVVTLKQAKMGCLVLFVDALQSASNMNQPAAVQVANKIKTYSAWKSFFDRLVGGDFEAIYLSRIKKAIKTFWLAALRLLLTAGGGLLAVGMAIYIKNEMENPKSRVWKPLSQSKGRAWITTRDFQRV